MPKPFCKPLQPCFRETPLYSIRFNPFSREEQEQRTNRGINAGARKQRRQCFCLWKKPLFLGAGALGKNKTDFINLVVIPARRACGDVLTVDRQFDGTDYTWYHGIVESASSLELIGDGGWVAHSFIRLI